MHTELIQVIAARLDRLPIEAPKNNSATALLKPAAKAQNGKQRRCAFCNKVLPKNAPRNKLYCGKSCTVKAGRIRKQNGKQLPLL